MCVDKKLNTTCDLTCKTNDHNQIIRFYKDGKILDSCIPFGDGNVRCSSHNRGRSQLILDDNNKETVLRIQKLNVLLDTGTWHCSYGQTLSEKKELIVYSKYTGFLLVLLRKTFAGSRKVCRLGGSGGGRVVKHLACRARGPGFDSRSRHLNFRDWLSPASKS